MRPTVQTERVLNKLAVSDGQRRLASVPIPFQFRFVPPLSRSLDVARSRSEFSSIRVSIRGQFPDGRCSELGDRREKGIRERCRSHRWSKAGQVPAHYCAVENVGPRSYTMSGRLMRLRGNGYEADGTGRERREGGQHGERCIGRRTNLCRCHANVRIRFLFQLFGSTVAGLELSSKRISRPESEPRFRSREKTREREREISFQFLYTLECNNTYTETFPSITRSIIRAQRFVAVRLHATFNCNV